MCGFLLCYPEHVCGNLEEKQNATLQRLLIITLDIMFCVLPPASFKGDSLFNNNGNVFRSNSNGTLK